MSKKSKVIRFENKKLVCVTGPNSKGEYTLVYEGDNTFTVTPAHMRKYELCFVLSKLEEKGGEKE